MKRILLFIIPVFMIWGLDQCIDVAVSFIASENGAPCDEEGSQKLSNLWLEHRIVDKKQDMTNLASFRLKADLYGSQSVALGLGVRKPIGGSYVGVHLFNDYSRLFNTHTLQIGPNFEFNSKYWDFYFNSYSPIALDRRSHTTGVSPCHYLDAGVVFKSEYYHVGLSPNFNLTKNTAGLVLQAKVFTPFGYFYFDTGKDATHGQHAKLGFNFCIIGSQEDLNRSVYRHTGVIYVTPKAAPKKPSIYVPRIVKY